LLATYATEWLGAANVRRYAVQFREQMWPGDVLVCTATVVRRHEAAGERLVDIELLGSRAASGNAAVVAEATFVVPD
jgi:hypothetical protein